MPVLTNVRHELFAQAVAKGAELVEAYEQAGFNRHEGNASRLRVDEKVTERIDELLHEAAIVAGITVERITNEIAAIAFLDLREAADWGTRRVPGRRASQGRKGTRAHIEDYLDLKPAKDLPPRVARAISSIKKGRYGVEIRTYNKLDALVRLGTQLGMWKEKDDEKSGADALVEMIVKAHERATSNRAVMIEGETVR